MPRVIQPSFAAGELAPSLAGRVDLAKYMVGAALLENFFVHRHGGVSNRPGTVYVAAALGPGRLIPFEFSTVQTYMLEFTALKMRIIKDGALVIYPVGHPSAGTVVEIVSPFAYADLALLNFVQSADTLFFAHPSYPPQKLVRTDHHLWTFSELAFAPTTAAPVSVDADYSKSPGSTTRVIQYEVSEVGDNGDESLPSAAVSETIDSPWASGARVNLKWNPLVLSGTWKWAASGSGTSEYYLTTTADGDPAIAEPAAVWANKVALTAGDLGTLAAGTWGWGDNDTLGFDTLYVRLSDSTDPDTKADYYVQFMAGVSFNIYKESRGYFGWILNVPQPWAVDDYIGEATDSGPQTFANPFAGENDYPGSVAIFEQRLVFARTNNKPTTVWTSRSGQLVNFGVSSPLADNDAITATLASRTMDAIRHMVPVDKLLLLTAGSEWNVGHGDSSEALTPSSIQFRVQGYRGCDYTPPLVIGDTVLFVERNGGVVRELMAQSPYQQMAPAADLTIMVPHMFEGRSVVAWAYQAHPDSLVWVVMSDGALLAFTYLKEQEVWAWTRHTTAGDVESVACLPGDTTDDLYFIVKRTVGGVAVRYLERLAARSVDWGSAIYCDSCLSANATRIDISSATAANPVLIGTVTRHYFNDGDEVYIAEIEGMTELNGRWFKVANSARYSFTLQNLSGEAIDGSAFAAYTAGGTVAKGARTFSGLAHLEGEEVCILADGSVEASQTVAAGAVTLGHAALDVHIGLPYTASLQTLPLEVPGPTIQGAKKAIPRLTVRFLNSRGLWAGPDLAGCVELKFSADEGYNEAIRLFTGDKRVAIGGRWDVPGQVYVQQRSPLPVTILAVIPEVTLGG